MKKTQEEKQINMDIIGENSSIKLSVRMALWLIGGVFSIVMTILSYSYFDLKRDLYQRQDEFMQGVERSINDIKLTNTTIQIDQATMKGDIKLILERTKRSSNNIKAPINLSTPNLTTNSAETEISFNN